MSAILSGIFWITQVLSIPFAMGLWPWFINRWTGRPDGRGLRAWAWLLGLCLFLGWVQLAQFLLVALTEVPIALLSDLHIPGSFVLFPLSLAAMLGLYAAKTGTKRVFWWVAAFLLALNAGMAAATYVLRAGLARDLGFGAAWAPVWGDGAAAKIVWGAVILLVDLYAMTRAYSWLAARGVRRFVQISVPLLLALLIDSVLFAGVIAVVDGHDYDRLLLGQGASKFVTGVVYSFVVYGYFAVYEPDPAAAAAPPARDDNPYDVFRHVSHGACTAVLSVVIAVKAFLGVSDSGLKATPQSVTTSVLRKGSDAPPPSEERVMDDTTLPDDGPNAAAQAAARAQFAADYDRLLADPDLRGKWVAYRGPTRLAVADAKREAVVRWCLGEGGLAHGQFAVFRVRVPAGRREQKASA